MTDRSRQEGKDMGKRQQRKLGDCWSPNSWCHEGQWLMGHEASEKSGPARLMQGYNNERPPSL